ncbi:MAG: class I SAM-dependent methyltransferase [Armatimonadota bacterium]|nr:class I SAM-dependent methyltransferase [Armatimonadota bacterium]
MRNSNLEKMLYEREAVLVSEYDAALDLASFDTRDTVLDVATGSGRMLLQILKRGYSVISGDINQEALDKTRERLGSLADKPTLVILDAHKLPFDEGSFHAITFVNAIHEIDNPSGVLDEITRVLADNGRLLIVEFNAKGFELMELHHQMQGKGKHRKGEMSTEDIDQHLRSSFDSVETKEFTITRAWVASGKKTAANELFGVLDERAIAEALSKAQLEED